MKIADAVIDKQGMARLLDPVGFAEGERVLVVAPEERVSGLRALEGCIAYAGRPVRIEEMNTTIMERGGSL